MTMLAMIAHPHRSRPHADFDDVMLMMLLLIHDGDFDDVDFDSIDYF